MTRATIYERTHRSAPRTSSFNGGHVEHGRIIPMQEMGLLQRIIRKVMR